MSARILVVDDDPWILRMVTATLRKRSYTVDTAKDGRQALERVRAHAPDVIISDVMMPVMDGWAFVKQLRQDPRVASIPVIFLTALGKDEAKLRALGLGEEDFLAKPFRFDELERRVDAALSSRRPAAPPPGYGPPNQNSGVYNMPGPTQSSGVYNLPGPPQGSGPHPMAGYPHAGVTHNSGVHPLPGYPPPGPTQGSGVHQMPTNPYGYPPGQYPGQYPPQYGQYPGQYPPPGQYPGQYPPPGQYPGQYPPPGYPGAPGAPPPMPPEGGVAEPPRQGRQRPRRATGLHGKLEQLGLSSLLVMMEMERKQGVLTLSNPEGTDTGRVFLRGGRVVAAQLEATPGLDQRECVYRMLAWKAGSFSFSAVTVDVEDTVQSSTTHLLMEGARLIDEASRDEGL